MAFSSFKIRYRFLANQYSVSGNVTLDAFMEFWNFISSGLQILFRQCTVSEISPHRRSFNSFAGEPAVSCIIRVNEELLLTVISEHNWNKAACTVDCQSVLQWAVGEAHLFERCFFKVVNNALLLYLRYPFLSRLQIDSVSQIPDFWHFHDSAELNHSILLFQSISFMRICKQSFSGEAKFTVWVYLFKRRESKERERDVMRLRLQSLLCFVCCFSCKFYLFLARIFAVMQQAGFKM